MGTTTSRRNTRRRGAAQAAGVLLLAGLLLVACRPVPAPEPVAGYVHLGKDTVRVDPVEVITPADQQRKRELGLSDRDMPSGYAIREEDTGTREFSLTGDTEFVFVDIHLLFVEDPDSDRLYTTTRRDEYVRHLEVSLGTPFAGEIPYPLFLEVQGDRVVRITEKLLFTQ